MPRCYDKAAERIKVEENAVRSAGQERVRCMAETNEWREAKFCPYKRKTAKLLQQLGGAPRFGKRRLHLQTV